MLTTVLLIMFNDIIADKPDRPEGPLEQTNITHNSVDLTWQPPKFDGGAPITSYVIEARKEGQTMWQPIGKTKGNILTYKAEELREGQEYYFRVAAVNEEGQGPALEGKDTVKPIKKIGKID